MSIVEPCVLELLKHADSRYTLVVEASKRGRQIIGGSKPLLDNEGMKPLKTAVEEINRGLITYDEPNDETRIRTSMCCDLPDVRGRHVVLGVTGGIAVYKSCEIVSRLRKLGVETHVIMTKTRRSLCSR